MENKTTPIQYFEQFAADRLKIHLAELNTSYENEELISRPCNAYSEHKEIFSQELEEIIAELSSGKSDQQTGPGYKFDEQWNVCENLLLDLNKKTATVDHVTVDLTRKEYDLLLYFLGNKNRVISKNAIAEHLWGDNINLAKNYDFVYTHIKNLRKKLIQAGCADYIRSIYGMGYKFDKQFQQY